MAREGERRPETLQELLDEHRIVLNGPPRFGVNMGGSRYRIWCPECGGGREKERNFFVKIDPDGQGATWQCFRANNCQFKGGGRVANAPHRPQSEPRHYRRPTPPTTIERPDAFLAYWAKQGITEATLQHFGVHRVMRRMPVLDADGKQLDRRREIPVIAYPYRDGGGLVNCKYKAIYPRGDREHKRFEQEKDAEPTLYNIEAFTDEKAGYFVEGENDCLAMWQSGFKQVTTVPNGSPPKLADNYDPANDEDERYIPLRPGDERIDRLKVCYLAGDNDPAGLRHMEEMARRLGKHRCWLVRWPAGCKDAFDTFRQGGPHAVDRAVKNATRYPLDGVNAVTNQQIDDLYRRREGWRYMTGYASLDERLKLADQEGLFICTTGVPGHGKTAFWTSYAGALTIRHEQHMASNPALPPFHTVIMSVEMPNLKIARDLISLHARKPFYPVPARERLDAKEMVEVHLPWVNRHFTFMKWDRTDQQPTISWAINVIVPVVKQTGAKLVIIDPWQEFDDEMPMNWRDTSSRWIKKVLWRLRGLAEELCINLVLVAHPAKMKRDRNGHFAVPGGYDIGESQAFNSVPHVGLTIHRPNLGAEQEADEMDIHCWKMRDILYGRVGKTTCRFDQHTHCLYPRPTVAEAVAGMDAESA